MIHTAHPILQTDTCSPKALAIIEVGNTYPDLFGIALFYETLTSTGLLIEVEVYSLPPNSVDCPQFLGMHIHEKGDCSNNFANTGMHLNPNQKQHPCHLGDLPPLLNNNGYAYLCFYNGFLTLDDVLGHSLVIHKNRDDFTSQPAGNSGDKIACGVINPFGEKERLPK